MGLGTAALTGSSRLPWPVGTEHLPGCRQVLFCLTGAPVSQRIPRRSSRRPSFTSTEHPPVAADGRSPGCPGAYPLPNSSPVPAGGTGKADSEGAFAKSGLASSRLGLGLIVTVGRPAGTNLLMPFFSPFPLKENAQPFKKRTSFNSFNPHPRICFH